MAQAWPCRQGHACENGTPAENPSCGLLPAGSLGALRSPRPEPWRAARWHPRAPSQPQWQWRTSAQPLWSSPGGRPAGQAETALRPPKTAPAGAPTPRAQLRLSSGGKLQLPQGVRAVGAGGPEIQTWQLSMGGRRSKTVVSRIVRALLGAPAARARRRCRGQGLGWLPCHKLGPRALIAPTARRPAAGAVGSTAHGKEGPGRERKSRVLATCPLLAPVSPQVLLCCPCPFLQQGHKSLRTYGMQGLGAQPPLQSARDSVRNGARNGPFCSLNFAGLPVHPHSGSCHQTWTSVQPSSPSTDFIQAGF